MNITRRWKKFLAVGCSHGYLADRTALDAVLRFRERWRPDAVFHLGDCFDTTAFRAGATGTADESAPIAPDLDSGLKFLKLLHPTVFICGNHEDRLWRLQHDNNAIVAELSSRIIQSINDECGRMRCRVVPWEYKQSYPLGNYSLFHGTVFSEHCCRDHAELHGNCIFAHAHRAGIAPGRRSDCPMGLCVGTLIDVKRAEYAKARKSTYAWTQGFVWGQYTDTQTVAWLHMQPQGSTEWVFPL